MKLKNKKKQIIVAIIILLILAIIIIKTVPIFIAISSEAGRIELETKISNMGIKGILMLILLNLVQIFLVVIPGEPVEILSGMCYRKHWWTYNNANRNIYIKYNYSVRSPKSRKKIYNGIYK